jgi:hypothetical protein
MLKDFRLAGFCCWMLCSLQLVAQSDDELFAEFDDYELSPTQSTDHQGRTWQFGGQLYFNSSYSYDLNTTDTPYLQPYEGISKLQSGIRLHANYYKGQWRFHAEARGFYDWLYQHEGRSSFTDAAIDQHESESEWYEVYLQGPITDNLELKTGRQILVWGRSDNIRILDQLNPLDLREPGSTDIEAIRLPVNMTRLNYSRSAYTLSITAIHEIRFHKLPAPGSEFLDSSVPQVPREEPQDKFAAEHAIGFTGIFSGWDFSLHHARLYEDEAYLDAANPLEPVLKHNRMKMSGLAINKTFGNWLLKTEFARFSDLILPLSPLIDLSRSDLLLGIEYAGYANTQIAVETAVRHLHDFKRVYEFQLDEDEWQTAIRFNRNFLNEKWQFVAVALFRGAELDDGRVVRSMIEWKPRDAISISAGLVIYSGEGALATIEDRDRLLFRLKYYF